MTPAKAIIPNAKFRHALRLRAPRPAKPNNTGNTKAKRRIPSSLSRTPALGEGVWVWICITLVPGVQVCAPPAPVVQAASTLTGVKVQVVLRGSPEQERGTKALKPLPGGRVPR